MKGVGGDGGCACSGVRLSCVLADTVRWGEACWVGLGSKLDDGDGGNGRSE